MEGINISVENGEIVIRLSSDRAEELSSALASTSHVPFDFHATEAEPLVDHMVDKLADVQMELLTEGI